MSCMLCGDLIRGWGAQGFPPPPTRIPSVHAEESAIPALSPGSLKKVWGGGGGGTWSRGHENFQPHNSYFVGS